MNLDSLLFLKEQKKWMLIEEKILSPIINLNSGIKTET